MTSPAERSDGTQYIGERTGERESRRAGRLEVTLLLVYFAAVVVLTDVFNVRLGVELLTLCVLLAALLITRRPFDFLRDWWFFLVGLVMWNLSGPIAAQSTFPAHLEFMLNLDRALFFGHDPVRLIQLNLKGAGVTWLDLTTSVVYNMHLAEPYIAGYILWRLNRALYFQFAACALILLVVGFATFIVFPAVPPWLAADYGRLPGVQNLFGIVLRWHPMPFHGTPIFYLVKLTGDPIAAMPSEHAAFPMIELLTFASLGKRYVFGFSAWVVAVLFSVVYLGEHWLTDVLAGWLYAAIIVLFVRWYVHQRSSHVPHEESARRFASAPRSGA